MESLTLFPRRAFNQSVQSTTSTVLRPLLRSTQIARPYSSLRPLARSQLRPSSSPRSQLDHRIPFLPFLPFRRHESSLTVPADSQPDKPPTDLTPAYQLTFTCQPCRHRSAHRVSKQGYHHGTVLITCPNCKERHVITDHLKIFMDQPSSLEDILEKANVGGKPLSSLLKKGKLGIRQGSLVGTEGEEDIEFWEDGSETVHEKDKH